MAVTDDFNDMVMKSFTTLPSDPSLLGVSVGSITQTTAVATVNVANPGNAQTTVHLKYSIKDANSWTKFNKIATTGSESFNLTGLTPGTMYEQRRSAETSQMPVQRPSPLPSDPSILGVSVGSITLTTAVATVNVANPGNAQTTVHLKYSIKDANSWTNFNKIATTGSESFNLTGLIPGTMYEVHASLSRDFTDASTVTFTTLPSDPSLLGVSVGSITQTTAVATVKIANPGNARKTVHLKYSIKDANIQLDEIQQDRYHRQ